MEDNTIQKLKKMIAHQQSAAALGNTAEAEAFAQRIQQWLTKHKLSMSDLQAKEEEKEGVSSGLAVDPRRFGMKDKDDMIPWLLTLAHNIAKVNDCEILVNTKVRNATKAEQKKTGKFYASQTTNQFVFVGIETDRLVAEELYVYMAKLAWEMAGKEGDRLKESFRAEIMLKLGKCAGGHLSAKLHDFRHSFCKGFAKAVTERLVAAREKEKAAAQAASNTETGLMVIDRRALMVRTYMEKNSTKSANASFYGAGKTNIGFALGFDRGSKVVLTSKTVNK